ncbi:MAG TPA: MFS transporter [Terriglobales bacterium]|nr:MFS transporter [Terriglobales bacterium]
MNTIQSGLDAKYPGRLRVSAWLSGELLSLIGDQVYFIALSWTAIRIGGPAALGVILMCAAIPRGLLMLYGGALVDLVGARSVALVSDFLRAAIMAVTALSGSFHLLELGVVAAMFGAFDAVFYPASGSLPRFIVPSGHLTRVQGLRTLLTQVALIAGSPVGGIVLVSVGPRFSFAVNASTFVASAGAIAWACPPLSAPSMTSKSRKSLLGQAMQGVRIIAAQPRFRILILTVSIFEFTFNGIANIGFPQLAVRHHWGVGGFSILVASLGAGAALVAASSAIIPRLARSAWTMRVATAICIPAAACFALSASLSICITAAACIGAAGALMNVHVMPSLQDYGDMSQLGSVMGLFSLATVGMTPLSQGAAAAAIALAGASAVFGAAGLIAAVLFTWLSVAATHRDLCKTPGIATHPASFRNLKKIGDTPREITSNGSSAR